MARKIAIILFTIAAITACGDGGGNGGANQSGDTAVTWDHSNWDEQNWQ